MLLADVMLRERGSLHFRKENSRTIFSQRIGFETVIRWFITLWIEKDAKLPVFLLEDSKS